MRGLGDGTLPLAQFRAYVAQDKYFLEAFARAYALALGAAPGAHGVTELATLISGVADELKLHGGYAAKWGVSLDGVVPNGACAAYVAFLDAAARGATSRGASRR